MENITDVKCLSCGAPAQYEIKKGCYLCQYCGGKVSVKEALEQKKGFRQLHQKKMMDTVRRFPLFKASCKSCGAEVVFNENDALAKCAFCGKSLVRKNYMQTNNMPELIIPFKITREEAKERLLDWCNKNRLKAEARRIKETLVFLPERTKLQKEIESNTDLSENVPSEESKASEQSVFNGFYLPYELVKGPVYCSVTRLAEGNEYYCDGYIDEVFVNRSSQLNNLLLDGMEPYKLSELTEFDFAYVAGHQVKIGDINERELDQRISDEVAKDYAPAVRKVLESKAVSVDVSTRSLMRLPVLLPAYYFSDGDIIAAVNGQTGKVSVQSIRATISSRFSRMRSVSSPNALRRSAASLRFRSLSRSSASDRWLSVTCKKRNGFGNPISILVLTYLTMIRVPFRSIPQDARLRELQRHFQFVNGLRRHRFARHDIMNDGLSRQRQRHDAVFRAVQDHVRAVRVGEAVDPGTYQTYNDQTERVDSERGTAYHRTCHCNRGPYIKMQVLVDDFSQNVKPAGGGVDMEQDGLREAHDEHET